MKGLGSVQGLPSIDVGRVIWAHSISEITIVTWEYFHTFDQILHFDLTSCRSDVVGCPQAFFPKTYHEKKRRRRPTVGVAQPRVGVVMLSSRGSLCQHYVDLRMEQVTQVYVLSF